MDGVDPHVDPSLTSWKPEGRWKPEDRLLYRYWKFAGGLLYAEVSVVSVLNTREDWPKGSRPRRIDGVRVLPGPDGAPPSRIATFGAYNAEEFERAVTGASVELIEVKTSLDRYVIGQAMVGAELLKMAYDVEHVVPLVVCRSVDSVLKGICDEWGIGVWSPPALESTGGKHPDRL